MTISYGPNVADDAELRLCGELAGKRAIELGIARPSNAVDLAVAGAKTIAIDPDAERISAARAAAQRAEVHVECHANQLADLGDVTSASVDLVLAVHSLDRVEDINRLFRQVHRVLRPGCSFVVAIAHPVAAMFDHDGNLQARYGARQPTWSELYMAFERTNFHIDALHELAGTDRTAVAPVTMVLRARKQGN
jgi:ubiquinone/menaquinone biosynthesis C-methylase UbiE